MKAGGTQPGLISCWALRRSLDIMISRARRFVRRDSESAVASNTKSSSLRERINGGWTGKHALLCGGISEQANY